MATGADLLPVASGLSELAWFENPAWEHHLITDDPTRPENVAIWDTDSDGVPEIGLVSGFSQSPTRSAGIVSVLTHDGNPSAVWSAAEIDRLPASHRVRWVDFDGSGNRVLVGTLAQPPDPRAENPVVSHRPGLWQREVVAASDGLVHGPYASDWSGSRRDTIITAGFAGVYTDEYRDGAWRRRRILGGNPAPWPANGASEFTEIWVAAERWLATIEPCCIGGETRIGLVA